MRSFIVSIIATAALLLFTVAGASAQQTLSIDIFGPGQGKVNMTMVKPLPLSGTALPAQDAKELEKALVEDFKFMPFLNMIPVSKVLGGEETKGVTKELIDFKRFQMSRVDLVLTTGWKQTTPGTPAEVELRVYEAFTGKLVLGKAYDDVSTRHVTQVADKFASALFEALTGKQGIFDARIAYVSKQGEYKELWTVSATGRGAAKLLGGDGLNLSPSVNSEGTKLVFTRLDPKGHRLGIIDLESGELTLEKLKGTTAISPTFDEDDNIVLTLDISGGPDIWMLKSNLRPDKTLVKGWGIDVSPSFDAKGERMVFASGRFGNPHIFVLDMKDKSVTRVTYEGKYNTAPSISPDGRYVAFSRATPGGHRIFVHDMATGMERQITDGPGSDEDPAFSPDGYYIAFSSSRSGQYKLYLTTRNGDNAVPVPTPGPAKAPAWIPARD